MKKQFFLTVLGLGLAFSMMAQGTKAEGKKGGSASAGNHKVEARGHKGGSAKVDKAGVHIKGKNGGSVEVGNNKKKKKK